MPSGKLGPLQEQLYRRSLKIKEEDEDDRKWRRLFCFFNQKTKKKKEPVEEGKKTKPSTCSRDVDTSCQCVATSCQHVLSEKNSVHFLPHRDQLSPPGPLQLTNHVAGTERALLVPPH